MGDNRRKRFWRLAAWVVLPALVAAGCKRKSTPQPSDEPNAVSKLPQLQLTPKPHGDPTIAGCPLFPADNVWNTRIDKLPKDPRSDAYLDSIGVTQRLHADFGSNPISGIPVTMAPDGAPPAKIHFQYDNESDHVGYPLTRTVGIEGGDQASGDRHAILIDDKACMLYELWHLAAQPDQTWTAGSGARFDLRSNALRKDGETSADAAGLPILPGLVRFDEVDSGEIRHALRFTLPQAQHAYVWPARHQASADRNPNQPPFGLRLRLRADFDISRYSAHNRVILKALQTYGMILADLGQSIYLSGSPDERWNDEDLNFLERVKGLDFEVVDELSLQIAPDSGQARHLQ
jgi:hypothetical protein